MAPVEELRRHFATIAHLEAAAAVLAWDQRTFMPPQGAAARAEQQATLRRLAHERLVSEETARLLEEAEKAVEPDSDEGYLVRAARRLHRLQARVPPALRAEVARSASLAHQGWLEARRQNRFEPFLPHLRRMVRLNREVAEHRGYPDHPYDALLEEHEPGMTTHEVRRLFAELRPGLQELLQAIRTAPQVDASFLERRYPRPGQEAVCRRLAADLGYDFRRGRLDPTEHPFCISFSVRDVRITNRYREDRLATALFGTLHEVGHALYEQGMPEEFEDTPLRGAPSLGFHESQSRLWENPVGRSRSFWRYGFPLLQEQFPETLADADPEAFYRAVNRVAPSPVRTESDELTYHLHIMLRFELEVQMVEGSLPAEGVPHAWDTAMEEFLGLQPPDPRQGCLQDIHWASGLMGYFPTYTLGSLLAAQLWETATAELGDLAEELSRGEFGRLRRWLGWKVHRQGRKYLPRELILRITGRPLDPGAFLRQAREKYREIYGADSGQRARAAGTGGRRGGITGKGSEEGG